MFLHSRSLKCFLHCLYISASLYHISYPPTLFGGYTILVTSPQECCLSWVNLWKYLWKHLLFWFAIPWNLSNISFHRTSHQIYRLKTFIRDFFAFSSQFWIPHFRKKKKHNNSHNNNTITKKPQLELCKQSSFFPAKSDARWFLTWFSSFMPICFSIVNFESGGASLPTVYFI